MNSTPGDSVEAAGVVFAARPGRHWTQRRWRATVDGNIGLTVYYRSATIDRPDRPGTPPGWYLTIDWPPHGPVGDVFLAKGLEAARETAARNWLKCLHDEVEDHSAEPDFEARWGRRHGARQTTVMTARLAGAGSSNTPQRTIRVPDPEWDAAKEAADANGETLSDVIRTALRRYVARNAKRAASPTS